MRKQAGMSFLEVFATILISLTLIQVLLEVYKNALELINHISSLQSVRQNILLATRTIEDDIKYAGYTGCLTQDRAITIDSGSLAVSHASMPTERLTEKMVAFSEVKIGKSIWLYPGDQVVISDCIHTEISTISKVYSHASYQIINLTIPFKYLYSQNATISKFQKHIYKLDTANHQLYYLDSANHKMVVASDLVAWKVSDVNNQAINFEYKFQHGNISQTVYQFISHE